MMYPVPPAQERRLFIHQWGRHYGFHYLLLILFIITDLLIILKYQFVSLSFPEYPALEPNKGVSLLKLFPGPYPKRDIHLDVFLDTLIKIHHEFA